MNKEDLKFGYIYQIKYTNPYCHNASYHGNAIFRNKDEGELYFDLIDGDERDCIFFEEDVIKEIGSAMEPITVDPKKITRITVVGENGREFEKMFDVCEISIQDDGRTLKIFYKDKL